MTAYDCSWQAHRFYHSECVCRHFARSTLGQLKAFRGMLNKLRSRYFHASYAHVLVVFAHGAISHVMKPTVSTENFTSMT